ncbi:MAG: guanylate kinase [Chloroflexi bacterium]|nr:guanylate kinase [Chloroflexota bacterium]
MTKAPPPLLIVLSGPSGVGKDEVLARLKQRGRPMHYAVTSTTRPPRPGEKDGQPYYFLSPAQFQEMIVQGEFLEWATVYGHRYGVPKKEVGQALAKGMDVMVKVDIQGAATIKGLIPQALLIFLAPPSEDDLVARLEKRNSEKEADRQLRLEKAREEMRWLPLFDYVVTNHHDRVDEAVDQIDAIIVTEKCRQKPRLVNM